MPEKSTSPFSGGFAPPFTPRIVALVDELLNDHSYAEIADRLNEQGLRPGGSARPGRKDIVFTVLRVGYLVNNYRLRSRYDRLRDQGMLTKGEAAQRFAVHEATPVRWAQHGLVVRHAYNGHAFLYDPPGSVAPVKHSSRWDQLTDRVAALGVVRASKSSTSSEGVAV